MAIVVAIGAFYTACKNGDLDTVIRLGEDMTPDDARESNNYALLLACDNGHLAVAQWLTNYFGLTIEDVRTYDYRVFKQAYWKGHLAVAQWLAENFRLTQEDVRANNNYLLRWTCDQGLLISAQWLVNKFELTAEDAGEHADMLDFTFAGGLGPKSAAKVT